MTSKGIIDCIKLLCDAYPNYHPNKEGALNLWSAAFRKFDDRTVQEAVTQWIITDTSGFAPVVGQIINIIYSQGIDTMSEVEAWGYVSKALRNSNYGAEEEFKKLPESVKLAIGNPDRLKEWAVLDEKEVQTVVASNFMRSYRAKSGDARKMAILPEMAMERLEEG